MSKFDLDWEEINAEADLQARLSFNPDLGVPFEAWVASKRRAEVTKAFRERNRSSDDDLSTFPDARVPSQFDEAFKSEVKKIIADAVFLLGKAEQKLLVRKYWNDESLSSSDHKRSYIIEQSIKNYLLKKGYKPQDLMYCFSKSKEPVAQSDQPVLFTA